MIFRLVLLVDIDGVADNPPMDMNLIDETTSADTSDEWSRFVKTDIRGSCKHRKCGLSVRRGMVT